MTVRAEKETVTAEAKAETYVTVTLTNEQLIALAFLAGNNITIPTRLRELSANEIRTDAWIDESLKGFEVLDAIVTASAVQLGVSEGELRTLRV